MLEVSMAHSQLLKGRLYIDLEVADSYPLAAYVYVVVIAQGRG